MSAPHKRRNLFRKAELHDIKVDKGVPMPKVMLAGAIVFLIAGSLSIIVGYKARIGASLLLIFLVLATYFFHDFWMFEDAAEKQQQMIAFMKNLSLIGRYIYALFYAVAFTDFF